MWQETSYQAKIQEIIPPGWSINAKTFEDVVFLGKENIQMMIQDWILFITDLLKQICSLEQTQTVNIVSFAKRKRFLHETRQNLIGEWEKQNNRIASLLILHEQAEDKPIMPDHRPKDWFRSGDTIMCYVAGRKERIVKIDFAMATIQEDHPFIVVEYSPPLYEGKYLTTSQDRYGTARPEIMQPWEFQYLLTHPTFAKIWAEDGVKPDRTKEFNADQFLAALSFYAKAPSAT